MSRDTTRRVSAAEARRQARIANGKDPDDLSDVHRGRPARPKKLKPVDRPPNPYVPAPPLSLADAASQLGVRPVLLAQAIQEGKVATVGGRGGELLIAHDELDRVRREGSGHEEQGAHYVLAARHRRAGLARAPARPARPRAVPRDVRQRILLNDRALADELDHMTDAHTDLLAERAAVRAVARPRRLPG